MESGPAKNIKKGWGLFRGLVIELEPRIGNKDTVYLGCTQRCFSLTAESGRMATVMAYNVVEFLGSCASKYCELAKVKTPLRAFSTPIRPEDRSISDLSAPGSGPSTECPWCHHTASPE